MLDPTPAERRKAGKAARKQAPLEAHADIGDATNRDPVGLIIGQGSTRVPELVPIRHGRMLVSPFTFYRGAALPMAADLSTTPNSGLRAQLCGDAHLSNFGVFAAPDRRLVFDLNDFDETLPGPFEWDVKRFAASLAVAGPRHRLDRHRTAGHGRSPGWRPTARAWPSSPRRRCSTSGTPASTSRTSSRPDRHPGQREGDDPHPQGDGQGAHPRQHAGAQEADDASSTAGAGSSASPPLVVPVEELADDLQRRRDHTPRCNGILAPVPRAP